MIVVRIFGTRKCSKAWMMSGKGVAATSRIATCTESHERMTMLVKRALAYAKAFPEEIQRSREGERHDVSVIG